MKKTLLIFAATLLFITCKKDNSAPNKFIALDATGAWTLYSSNDSFFNIGTVTADTYPCMASNQLTFKSDSTYASAFTGTAVCYVTPTQGSGSVSIGSPAQQPASGTWRRNGNDIYIGADHYVISNTNNKLQLTLNSSFTYNGGSYTTKAVYYKK